MGNRKICGAKIGLLEIEKWLDATWSIIILTDSICEHGILAILINIHSKLINCLSTFRINIDIKLLFIRLNPILLYHLVLYYLRNMIISFLFRSIYLFMALQFIFLEIKFCWTWEGWDDVNDNTYLENSVSVQIIISIMIQLIFFKNSSENVYLNW